MNHSEDPSLHSTLELDQDALNFAYLEEYLSHDAVGIPDGCSDGAGQFNFGFADDIANQDLLLSYNLGARFSGNLGFPSDGQVVSIGHPIDIPNFGSHHRRKNSPLTPPDSDGPDSPDVDQVFLPQGSMAGTHPAVVLSSVPLSGGVQLHSGILQHGESFSPSQELLSQSASRVSSSEPKRKRKRSSECSETLTTNGMSLLRLGSLKSESDDFCLDSCSESPDSPDPLNTPATPDPENSYQCLKWLPFKPDECSNIYDDASQRIPPPQFRVDADKGFNYSFADEAFVCQKKNHLQVTAYMNLQSEQVPKYVQVEQNELRRIEKFCLHLYGVKMESQASRIGVEQSQADRSKRHYEPLQFHISPKEQAKITVGRLHFSETTANNMRKKGKPNPDQRYFLLVVAVYAHSKNKEYLVCANVSERIIVRASNPGQFENDMEVVWSRGQTTDSVFRMGRVGINTDKPEEALSVHGNLKVTGRLVHPSDSRVKESIEEVDTSEQLRNVSKMKLYRYRYSREYLEHAGLATSGCEGEDTGVLAQEVKEVLPEAVKESEDLVLPDGKTIERFLVVNKERIFMENVGAVKELCKLTDNLEVRIDELETMNKKLQKKRCDTVSTFSSLSLSRCSSFRASMNSRKQNEERRKKCHHHHYCHHHHHHCTCRHHGVVYDEQGWCSPRFMQFLVVVLVLFMILSIGGMAILYVLEIKDDGFPNDSNGNRVGLVDTVTSSVLNSTTKQPSLSNHTSKTTLQPRKTTTSFSSSSDVVSPTKKRGTQHSTAQKRLLVTPADPLPLKAKPAVNANSSTIPTVTPRVTKTKPPNEPTLPSETKANGQCCDDTSIEYPTEQLRGKEVYYGKQNVGDSSSGSLRNPELRILENNYIIKCSNCSSRNTSHYIPFKSELPFKPITLEINSTTSSLVWLCSHDQKYGCPEQTKHPEYDTGQKKDSWKKCHRWQLPVAYYLQSTYHFRLVFSSSLGNVTCLTTPQSSGPPLQDLYFHFIRKCI